MPSGMRQAFYAGRGLALMSFSMGWGPSGPLHSFLLYPIVYQQVFFLSRYISSDLGSVSPVSPDGNRRIWDDLLGGRPLWSAVS